MWYFVHIYSNVNFYADFLQLYSYLFAISDIQFAPYFFPSWLKLSLGFVHVLY